VARGKQARAQALAVNLYRKRRAGKEVPCHKPIQRHTHHKFEVFGFECVSLQIPEPQRINPDAVACQPTPALQFG
jgi:hypothetical protein